MEPKTSQIEVANISPRENMAGPGPLSLFEIDPCVAAQLTMYESGIGTNCAENKVTPASAEIAPFVTELEIKTNGLFCSTCQHSMEDRQSQVSFRWLLK